MNAATVNNGFWQRRRTNLNDTVKRKIIYEYVILFEYGKCYFRSRNGINTKSEPNSRTVNVNLVE